MKSKYYVICGACGNINHTENYWLATYRCTHCGSQNDAKHKEPCGEPLGLNVDKQKR